MRGSSAPPHLIIVAATRRLQQAIETRSDGGHPPGRAGAGPLGLPQPGRHTVKAQLHLPAALLHSPGTGQLLRGGIASSWAASSCQTRVGVIPRMSRPCEPRGADLWVVVAAASPISRPRLLLPAADRASRNRSTHSRSRADRRGWRRAALERGILEVTIRQLLRRVGPWVGGPWVFRVLPASIAQWH